MEFLLEKRRRIWIIALFWLLIAVLFTTKSALSVMHRTGHVQWIQNFFYQGSGAVVWALFTPLLISLVKRFDLTKGQRSTTFLKHLCISMAIALSHRAIARVIDFAIRSMVNMEFFEIWNPFSIIYNFRIVILDSAISSFVTYWVLVIMLTGITYYIREIRNKPLATKKVDKLGDRLKVKVGDGHKLILIDSIVSCEASGNYITLNTNDRQYRIRETMTELEKKLSFPFIRVHRSSIVNVNYLESFQHLYQGEYLLKFNNGQQLTSTKRYRQNLMPFLSKN